MYRLLFIAFALLCNINLMAFDDDVQQLHDSILANISGADANQIQVQPVKYITAYGAKPGGVFDCLPAFRKAIRAASKSSRGMHIVVPEGTWYLKGPIHLVSNVTLELKEGAKLLFSPDPNDYLPSVKTSWEGSFCQNYSPFIYGYGLTNIAIIGKGAIDGNCADTFPKWRAEQKPDQSMLRQMTHLNTPIEERNFGVGNKLRPHLLQLFDCRNITIDGVFVTNSPFWWLPKIKEFPIAFYTENQLFTKSCPKVGSSRGTKMGQNLLKTYLAIFFHDVHVIKDLCYSFAKVHNYCETNEGNPLNLSFAVHFSSTCTDNGIFG